MGEKLPLSRSYCFGIDRADDTLAAKLICCRADHIRIGHCGRVEADFIRPCAQQSPHIRGAAHAATHGKGYIALLGCAPHNIEHRAAVFMRGIDV